MPADSPQNFGAEVFVTLKDGRKVSRRVDHMVGRSPDYPMTSDELFEKFSDCAKRALPKAQIAPLFERLETLESVADMRQVSRLIEPMGGEVMTSGTNTPAGGSARPGSYETGWVP
jgi:2-methylcitrate dehydratase PrpD